MLVLEDAGGELLDRRPGTPMEMRRFLRFAVAVAAALGKHCQRGLVHTSSRPG
jgi:hypothetical protein